MSDRKHGPLRAASALALFLAVDGTARALDPGPIAWRGDLPAARAEAAAADRLVWVQFTAPWCGACRRMERESFHDPRVADAASAGFVPVALSADRHEDLAQGLGVTALPATVILRPGGGVVARSEGYRGPEPFAAFLRSARARVPAAPVRTARAARPAPGPARVVRAAGAAPATVRR